MLATSFAVQALGVFGTGILASLSPCIYPMLPITLSFLGNQAGKAGHRRSVLLYVTGQTLALIAIGILAVHMGESLGFSSQDPYIQLAVGILLILMGAFSFTGWSPKLFSRWNSMATRVGGNRSTGAVTAFLFGVSAALVASPCTSPILGSVLALMATTESYAQGLLLMTTYSIGFSLLFLILGFGVVRLKKLPRAGSWMNKVHKFTGILMFAAGIYFIWVAEF